MKARVYLRIAKNDNGRFSVKATTKPEFAAMVKNKGYNSEQALPTILYALDLDIPDNAFSATANLLKIKLSEGYPATEVDEGNVPI